MRTGMQAEKRGVQLMRKPGKRMPVGRLGIRESPDEVGPAQAGGDMVVDDNILLIIVENERMGSDGPIEGGGCERKDETDGGEIFLQARGGHNQSQTVSRWRPWKR